MSPDPPSVFVHQDAVEASLVVRPEQVEITLVTEDGVERVETWHVWFRG